MAVNTFTPNLNLPLLSVDTKGGLYEFNRAMLNATMNAFCVTVSREETDPPDNPSEGDVYLVAPNGTGAWAEQGNKFAYYYNGWTFILPRIGFTAWDLNTNKLWTYNEFGWYGGQTVADIAVADLPTIIAKVNELLIDFRGQGLILISS